METITFSPPKTYWQRPLSGIEAFFADKFVPGALYFNGHLDQKRFLAAFKSTLETFHFMFGKVRGSFLQYDQGDTFDIVVEKLDQSLTHFPVQQALPTTNLGIGGLGNAHNVPLGVIKLTILSDGFVLGYYMNHVLFDQSSIVYFFKYLSEMYTGKVAIAPQIFQMDPTLKPYDSLEAFRKDSPGLRLAKFRREGKNIPLHPHKLSKTFLQEIQAKSDQFISFNDIINAYIIKHFATDGRFIYSCNMRKRLNLGPECIGNIITSQEVSLKREEIIQSDLVTLAKLNRQSLSRISVDKFKKDYQWYDHFKTFNQNPLDYTFDYLLDPSAYCISNWASFDYSAIAFDAITPFALKMIQLPAEYRTLFIGFENDCFTLELPN